MQSKPRRKIILSSVSHILREMKFIYRKAARDEIDPTAAGSLVRVLRTIRDTLAHEDLAARVSQLEKRAGVDRTSRPQMLRQTEQRPARRNGQDHPEARL